jgi:hypothetical protein
VLRSPTGTPPWRAVWSPPTDPAEPDWSTVAVSRGVTWVLHTEQANRDWRVLLTRNAGRSFSTRVLAEVEARRPRGDNAGDEYGGLAVGSDGSVWAAWSQPRKGRTPVITVARVPRP